MNMSKVLTFTATPINFLTAILITTFETIITHFLNPTTHQKGAPSEKWIFTKPARFIISVI
jgi:uncharacterized membrane protein